MVGIVMGLLMLWGVWLALRRRDPGSELRTRWWFTMSLATFFGVALIITGYHSAVAGH